MDRIDLPSEEVAEQMAEDCLDMIGRAIAARDAEWVAVIDSAVRAVTERKDQAVDRECGYSEAFANGALLLADELKARMQGDKTNDNNR